MSLYIWNNLVSPTKVVTKSKRFHAMSSSVTKKPIITITFIITSIINTTITNNIISTTIITISITTVVVRYEEASGDFWFLSRIVTA